MELGGYYRNFNALNAHKEGNKITDRFTGKKTNQIGFHRKMLCLSIKKIGKFIGRGGGGWECWNEYCPARHKSNRVQGEMQLD